MKPKHQRLGFIVFTLSFFILGGLFALKAFRDNLIYFYTPSDVVEKTIPKDKLIRLGGLVEAGSIRRKGDDFHFILTDGAYKTRVHYRGLPPNLFKENAGAVVQGYLTAENFEASQLLAKHDEKYMPKEVIEKLKTSGRWKEKPLNAP